MDTKDECKATGGNGEVQELNGRIPDEELLALAKALRERGMMLNAIVILTINGAAVVTTGLQERTLAESKLVSEELADTIEQYATRVRAMAKYKTMEN